MKKRALSLIEMIITLSLLSLLLTTLFFWYRSLTLQKEAFQQIRGPLLEERYAQQRLQAIFSSVELPFFTPSSSSLVFLFDRGPSLIPELSGKVIAKLYFDEPHQCLCLGVWPKPNKENPRKFPSQTFILLDKVSSCTFHFYNPPDPFKMSVDPEEVGRSRPQEKWQKEWKSAYHIFPALVKISITRDPSKGIKDHEFDYLFDLPVTVLYPRVKTA
jgi:prepilin-type N-terminal cleavage/methylation domain-containing protein